MTAQTNVQLLGQLARNGWSEADLARADAAYRLIMPLFGNRYRPDGRPFLCHLCGTASLVAAAGRAPDTVVAALLHAVFAQGRLAETGGASDANRAMVAEIAGEGPVEIILAYDALRWTAERILGLEAEDLAAAEREALVIRLANEADDNADGAAAFSEKQRYVGKTDLLEAIDRIAARLDVPELALALRRGLAEAGDLTLPPGARAQHRGSFDIRPRAPLWRRAARRAKRMLGG
jgi:(p)ppGpp synthase/HD superfamily hydrolase